MYLRATVIRDVLYNAASYGAAYDQLCTLAGFTQEEISDSEKSVNWEKSARLWELLVDLTGDELIGLHLGSEMNIASLGMVGFLVQSSKNIGEAFRVYCNYGYMVCPMVDLVYSESGRTATVVFQQNTLWQSKYPEGARQSLDSTLAGTICFLRALTGKNINPIGVETQYSKKNISEYNKLFQAAITFNAPETKMVFHVDDMATPLLSSDKSMYDLFNSILAQKKEAYFQNSCSKTLKQMLLMKFKGQIPTIEEAAMSLNMTPRTLQRKLMEEKTSYRNLANEVKKEIALQLLRNSPHNITAVAGILGYSDLPAFRRAFKNWTQETPKTIKRQTAERPELI